MTGSATVLHVLDHSWPILSGYSIRSRNLISAQHRLGRHLLVVTSPLHEIDDLNSSDTTVDGVTYRRTPISRRIAQAALYRRWPALREWQVVGLLRNRILQLAEADPFELIYAHSPALCGLAALMAARKLRLPLAYEIRAFWEDVGLDENGIVSLRYRFVRRLETYVAQRADAVAAISLPMLDDLRKRGIPSERLFHVPNGVEAEHFPTISRDDELARQLGLDGAPVFGFFGSLYRYEGVSWLIHAAAELHARGNKFNLLIIGRGEDREAIGRAVTETKSQGYVRLIDHVPHESISRYYSVVDVMVFPRLSLRVTELVTPLKPLEAMVLRKPVLASGVGGHREIVEHEKTGLIFRPGNVNDFCTQAARLLGSPALRAELSERGRTMVLEEKDWKILAPRYDAIYHFALLRQQGAQVVGDSAVAQPCSHRER